MNAICFRPIVRLGLLLLCAMPASAIGCSGSKPNDVVTVYGTVTFDGSPLSQGKVILEPAGGTDLRPFAGSIHDGKFQMECTPGKKTVRITATRFEEPKNMSRGAGRSMETDAPSTIPVQYNRNSSLTTEISAAGSFDLTFDLQK